MRERIAVDLTHGVDGSAPSPETWESINSYGVVTRMINEIAAATGVDPADISVRSLGQLAEKVRIARVQHSEIEKTVS